MSELSPAAQAVLDAANDVCIYRPDRDDMRLAVAAALRAAADQVVPESPSDATFLHCCHYTQIRTEEAIRRHLLTLAAELEAQ